MKTSAAQACDFASVTGPDNPNRSLLDLVFRTLQKGALVQRNDLVVAVPTGSQVVGAQELPGELRCWLDAASLLIPETHSRRRGEGPDIVTPHWHWPVTPSNVAGHFL